MYPPVFDPLFVVEPLDPACEFDDPVTPAFALVFTDAFVLDEPFIPEPLELEDVFVVACTDVSVLAEVSEPKNVIPPIEKALAEVIPIARAKAAAPPIIAFFECRVFIYLYSCSGNLG